GDYGRPGRGDRDRRAAAWRADPGEPARGRAPGRHPLRGGDERHRQCDQGAHPHRHDQRLPAARRVHRPARPPRGGPVRRRHRRLRAPHPHLALGQPVPLPRRAPGGGLRDPGPLRNLDPPPVGVAPGAPHGRRHSYPASRPRRIGVV
ncbi:MAG: hypothetical protein AVDCRST_MAG88-1637, partial [uncultured Thermomicrobiales bacterium]